VWYGAEESEFRRERVMWRVSWDRERISRVDVLIDAAITI